MDCYVQNVSPVTKASSSNRRYFSCTLQCKDNPVRAVCFSPEKQSQLKTLAQTKSPVKIHNFRKPDDGKDIFITKYTNITALSKDEINFEFQDDLTASADDIINLSAVPNLAPEQLITVKGHVESVSAAKLIPSQFQGKLKKQELLIRDTTAYTKVVLWEKYVDIVEKGKTYEFKNLRVKGSKQDRYLNTPKNETFEAKQCEKFKHPLVKIDEDITTSSTIRSKIMGIRNATKIIACVSCRKQVLPKINTPALGVCQSCHLCQPMSACHVQWTLKALVQNSNEPTRKLHLNLPHLITQDLLAKINPSVDLSKASEDELLITILEADKLITITYDSLNYQVSEIEVD